MLQIGDLLPIGTGNRKNNTLEHELKEMELTHAHIHTYNHIYKQSHTHKYIRSTYIQIYTLLVSKHNRFIRKYH